MNGFIYTPLTNPREIRVLDLKLSDDESARIELEMWHITLEDPAEMTIAALMAEWKIKPGSPSAYSALSYTWGDTKYTRLVKLNDIQVCIGANLESALRNLRERKVTTLWADAICINQIDDVEKSMQVGLMSEIYRCAFNVIIWLGEARATTALAVNFLKKHITRDFSNPEQPSIKNDLASTRLNPNYKSAWNALGQDLLKRPWWRRMWVIQEVVLARRTVIFCGPHDLPWDYIEIATGFALGYDLPIFYKTPEEMANGDQFLQARNLMAKARYREAKAKGDELHFQELLMNNLSCLTSKPQDMIFSLLGLATDVRSASKLRVDYGKTVKQVYTDLVKFQVREHKSLDIICASKHPKREADLPSWVPDWSNLRENTCTLLPPFEAAAYQNGRYIFRASGKKKLNAQFLDQDNTLSVSGIFFDTVADMAGWTDHIADLFEIFTTWQELAMGPNLIRKHNQYITQYAVRGETMLDAFNRTIVSDRTRSGHKAEEGQRGFEPFMTTEYNIPESYRQNMGLSDEEREEFWRADVLQTIELSTSRRRLILTTKGYLGLAPPNTEQGDSVVVIFGLIVPAILRKKEETWHFVGESFITGIMDGEVVGQGPSSYADAGTKTSVPGFKVEEILLCRLRM